MSDTLGIPIGWRILELGVRDDYFDIWKRIREYAPVHDAGEGVFLVTEWELVNSALRNPILRAGSGVSAAFGQDKPFHVLAFYTTHGEQDHAQESDFCLEN